MTGGSGPAAGVRLARRVYRGALGVLPRAFRAAHGEALQAFFDEEAADAHAAGGLPRLALRTMRALLDVAGTAWRARWPRSPAPVPPVMRGATRELRAAARALRRAPAFSTGVLATVALGVGVGTALFAVGYAALLAPLPVADEARLVHVAERTPAAAGPLPVSYPVYRGWRDGTRRLRSLAAYGRTNRTVTGLGSPMRVDVTLVTANLFETLGVPLAAGRWFRDAEELDGADGVVILSHAFRARHDPAGELVVGRVLRLGDRPFEIVGVLPEGFRFDLEPADVFVPLGLRPLDLELRESRWLSVVGRLDESASIAQAREELTSIAAAADPAGTARPIVEVRALRSVLVGPVSLMLWLVGGASLLVALASATSLTALAITRAIARRRELAVRAALGASRAGLLVAFGMEFVLLGVAGAGAAALAGGATARAAVHLLPAAVGSRAAYLAGGLPAGRLWVAALALAVLTSLPALAVTARDLRRAAPAGVLRAGTLGQASRSVRGVLVALQVALALVLLVGTGLMARSLTRLLAVDPGFAPDRLLSMSVSVPAERYRDGQSVARFYDELTRRVGGLPGVERAGVIDEMPFTRDDGVVEVEPRPSASAGVGHATAAIRSASPGYLETLGLEPIAGRFFDDRDAADRRAVAVITTTLAGRLFPDRSPVGRTLALTRSTGTFEIVGVVGDVRMGELDRDALPAFYTCSLQDPSRSAQLVVRTGVPAGELAASVRAVVAGIDAEVPVYAVRTLDEARGGTRGVAVRRLVYYPLLLFGALAAAIAAVGVYALVSQAVAERTPELGIRLALGASPAGIWRLVLRQGLAPVVAGIALGLAASAWAARALGAVLYETSPGDPLTFAGATAGLLLLAAAAAAGPAMAATRLDPLAAIRRE